MKSCMCCKRGVHELNLNPAPLSFRDSYLVPTRLPGITYTCDVVSSCCTAPRTGCVLTPPIPTRRGGGGGGERGYGGSYHGSSVARRSHGFVRSPAMKSAGHCPGKTGVGFKSRRYILPATLVQSYMYGAWLPLTTYDEVLLLHIIM